MISLLVVFFNLIINKISDFFLHKKQYSVIIIIYTHFDCCSRSLQGDEILANTSDKNKKTVQNGAKQSAKKEPSVPTKTKKAPEKKPAAPASRPKKESESEKAEKSAAKRQGTAIIFMAVAAFLLAVVFVEGESAWNLVHNFMFGAFGFCAYILPLLLIYMGVVYAKDKPLGGAALNLVSAGGFIVFLSSVIYLIKNKAAYFSATTISKQIYDVWEKRTTEVNGGVIGALVGGVIGKFFGKTGALITVFILLTVALFFLTGITLPVLASYIRRPVRALHNATNERFEKNAILREEARERRALEEAERAQEEEKAREQAAAEKIKVPPQITDNSVVAPKSRPGVFTAGDITIKTPSPGVDYEPINEPSMPKSVTVPGVPSVPKVPAGVDGIPGAATAAAAAAAAVPVITGVAAEAAQTKKNEEKKRKKKPEQTKTEVKPEDGPEKREYALPPIECLEEPQNTAVTDTRTEMEQGAARLIETLNSFKISAEITGIVRGPSVTRYELVPEAGVRISKITSLADDITMRLAAESVRIEAPIPGKSAIGIEIPNSSKSMVTLREIIDTDVYRSGQIKSKLCVALGKNITGDIITADLTKMPHLLVAGTTGSGKSVCMNAMILSILYNATPEEVKLLLIDPKQVEFIVYNGIAHLEVPVVTDVRKAAGALSWAVSEMEKRYKLFSEYKVRDIKGFNKYCAGHPETEKMHHIVIFIDELSDLMMAAPKEVEDSICRLAQMARAAGIHLVIATQSPRADIITGLIKANIPSRIALKVANSMESRIIFDQPGAEKLLGNGDLLFNPVGNSKPVRVQGCYVSDEEKDTVLDYIRSQSEADYDEDVMREIDAKAAASSGDTQGTDDGFEDLDPMFNQAVEVVLLAGQASTTMLQKKLKLGYARASRVMDQLEENGIVGPADGAKPRQVLISKQQWYEKQALAGNASSREKQLSFSDIGGQAEEDIYSGAGEEEEYDPDDEEEYEDEDYVQSGEEYDEEDEDEEDEDEPVPFGYDAGNGGDESGEEADGSGDDMTVQSAPAEIIAFADIIEDDDSADGDDDGEFTAITLPEDVPETDDTQEQDDPEPAEIVAFADIIEESVSGQDETDESGEEDVSVNEEYNDDFPEEIDAPVNIDDIFAEDADFAGDDSFFDS